MNPGSRHMSCICKKKNRLLLLFMNALKTRILPKSKMCEEVREEKTYVWNSRILQFYRRQAGKY